MRTIKLLVSLMLTLGFAGVSLAAPAVSQYITPSISRTPGGVVNSSGTSCNGQVNQTLMAVGSYNIKGVMVGSAGTAQCVAITDLANCQAATGVGVSGSVFEACAAANTATYFDFSNSPIKIVNGIVVTSSRTDGFASVYTQ